MNNKYGLTRNIDEHTKEMIRKRDGFGCVHCGRGIYTYEHFNPPFIEAKKHDVNGIALLCGQCQILTTKGILSKETIQSDVNDPFCRRQGYSNDFFDLKYPMLIYYGNFIYYASKDKRDHVMLKINNEITLGCSEDPIGGPMQLSAIFRDRNNQICLEIVKNEWKASTQNWDIRQIGRKLSIYEGYREIGIEIEVDPPNKIYFNSFTTYFNKNKLLLDREKMVIQKADGNQILVSTPDSIRRSAPININL
jgi:hypothetical protein